MKIITVFFLFLGISFVAEAQVNRLIIKQLLPAKKWGTRLFVEKYDSRIDTILNLRDCANEYVDIFANGTFESPNLKKQGTWEIVDDSTLLFKKSNGIKYKRAVVSFISKDSLVLTDRETPQDVFIETYRACGFTDSTQVDNRPTFDERRIWGITAGYQSFKAGYVDIGITRAVFDWKNTFFGYSLNAEINPTNKIYGLTAQAWSEEVFAYGLAVNSYIDTQKSKFYFGLRPMAGLSLKPLLSNYNMTAHILYGYNFLLGETDNEFINRHSITARMTIPFKVRIKKVRKLIDQEYFGKFYKKR